MENTGQLAGVKKMLHSVIVSSPDAMTLLKLSRDYKEIVGSEIPYRQLGFRDLENFLRSIPDIVKVSGSGTMAFVQPLATAESAHIQQFVKCQKKTSRPKNSHGRKPKYFYEPTPSDLVFINESVRKASSGQMYNPFKQIQPQIHPLVILPNYQYLNHHIQQSAAYAHLNNVLQPNRPIHPLNRPQMNASPIVYPAVHPQGKYKLHKYAQPIRRPYQVHQPPPPVRSSAPMEKKAPPVRASTLMATKPPPLRTSTPIEKIPPPVPKPTRVRTPSPDLDAIVKSVNDLSLANAVDVLTDETKAQDIQSETPVCKLTRVRTPSPDLDAIVMSVNDLSIANAVDVPTDETKAHDIQSEPHRSNSDKILANVTEPVEEEPVVELEDAQSVLLDLDKPPKEKSFDYDSSSDDCSDSEAFPAYAVDERVLCVDYPRDAVRADYKMPRRDAEVVLKVDERYFLQIVEMTNPHNFNFWIYDDYELYHNFSHNMQQVYKSLDSTTYSMAQWLMTPGHLCVVCPSYTTEWERAKIVSQRMDNVRKTIDVELIDSGVIDTVYIRDVKFLMEQFAAMPPQRIQGRLAYVSPLKPPCWSSKAVAAFKQQVSHRRLFGKVEAIKDNIAHVVLVDTDDVNLNRSLILSGLARRCLQT